MAAGSREAAAGRGGGEQSVSHLRKREREWSRRIRSELESSSATATTAAPGGKCFRALRERAGAFSLYRDRDASLVGYATCDGCPGGNIEYAPEEMVRNGANVIHLATGLIVGYPPLPEDRFLSGFHPVAIRDRCRLRHPSDSPEILSGAPGSSHLGCPVLAGGHPRCHDRRRDPPRCMTESQ